LLLPFRGGGGGGGGRLFALPVLHLVLLLVLAVAAATPLCWGSAGFARGVGAVLAGYDTAASNFSRVDAALTALASSVAGAQHDATALLREDPCHSSFAQDKLRTIQTQLGDATGFVAGLTRRLGPINATLGRVEGDVQAWGGKGELVRWWAVLAPCACVMLYVMLEVVASEHRACCLSLVRLGWPIPGVGMRRRRGRRRRRRRRPRGDGGGCGFLSAVCCLSRSVGRTVGVITLVALFGSSCVYLILGMAAADYCSGPDAVLVGGLDHEAVEQRQVIAFFALCPPRNATGYPQVRQFQSYFARAESAFKELDQAFEAYDVLCPATKSSRALENNMRAAETVFYRDVVPFQSCDAIQPQYCAVVADGVCGTFVSGAAETAVSQAGAGLLLFVSLLVSFLLGAVEAKEEEEEEGGALGEEGEEGEEDEAADSRRRQSHWGLGPGGGRPPYVPPTGGERRRRGDEDGHFDYAALEQQPASGDGRRTGAQPLVLQASDGAAVREEKPL
jgi:hypothetical protein